MFVDANTLAFLCLMALFAGFLKSGLPVLGGFITLAMALVFPPRDAVALTLMYLLAGDAAAIYMHWRNASWALLKKMMPAIVAGIVLGSLALGILSNNWLGLTIGFLFIFLVGVEPMRAKLMAWSQKQAGLVRNASGVLAGFCTVIGNVAGPVLSIYFLLLKIDKHRFVGTTALFFLIVNLIKVPVYAYIGIFKAYYIGSYLITLPLVFVGAFYGGRFLKWVPQKQFNLIILLFTGVGGFVLVLKYLPKILAN